MKRTARMLCVLLAVVLLTPSQVVAAYVAPIAAPMSASLPTPTVAINEVEFNGDATSWIEIMNACTQAVDISGWYLLGETCLALTLPRKRTMPIHALQNHSIKGFYRHGERACANKSTVYCSFSWELTIARIAAGPRGAQYGSVPEKSNSHHSEHGP